MEMIAYVRPGMAHQLEWMRRWAVGMRAHGVDCPIVEIGARAHPSDVAVVWGWNARDIIDMQRNAGGRLLVLERGYIGDRKAWTSAGWDGLCGRADFRNRQVTGARWDRHFAHYMREPRPNGDYALICGQCAGDAATRGVDLAAWYQAATDSVRDHMPVVFRPHPLQGRRRCPDGARMDRDALPDLTLETALRGARLVVTYNSGSGVDAALAGKPVIACDPGSMAWPVAHHGLEGAHAAGLPDRTAWAHRLAWCQWTADEMMDGDTWAHLS